MPAKLYQRIGMIARWRPVHVGQAAVLRALGQSAEYVLIGIGSSNRYNARNPFTLKETEDMLRLVLDEEGLFLNKELGLHWAEVEIIPVPDLDDGSRWREMVKDLFGELDLFLTDNPYVANLMKDIYRLAKPVELAALEERVCVDGSMVRAKMARGERWQDWVPARCVEYIESRGLDERFRREFGLQTLAMETVVS
jgi:nicotinamide-nucleotide adenylyltransferase